MTLHHHRVVIIGSGAAALTAAIYAARAMLAPVVLTGEQPGGQLTITTDVENYPGFENPIMGPELMEAMQRQATRVGATLFSKTATHLERTEDENYLVTLDCGTTLHAEAVILATGAKARWLGATDEQTYLGRGVSGCATCDGFFFRKKSVCVIGGGNTAFEEALYLAGLARDVLLIHRSETFRADKTLQKRVSETANISVMTKAVIQSFNGTDGDLRSITILQTKADGKEESKTLAIDGAFVAIGHDPASELVIGKALVDQHRYILTGHLVTDSGRVTETSLPGLFAAGDVADSKYRQAITAAGSGCQAALDAERYLQSRKTVGKEGNTNREIVENDLVSLISINEGLMPSMAMKILESQGHDAEMVRKALCGGLNKGRLEAGSNFKVYAGR